MKNYLKLISLSFLLLAASCSETSSDTVLQTSDNSNRSTKSVKLPVISIAAEIEQSNYPATNAIDNDFTSRWSGFGGSANLDLDLGSVNEIDFINIAFYKGDERATSFNIYTSTDNSNWDYLQGKTSSGLTDDLQLFDLINVEQARYIRLECLGNSLNDWNSIHDIKVYGTKTAIVDSSSNKSIPVIIESEN